MRNRMVWILLVAAGLLLAACGGGEAPVAELLAGDPSAGQLAYRSTCSVCHGTGGTGVSGLGADLTASTHVRDRTDAELVQFLARGLPAGDPQNKTGIPMPANGGNPNFTERDLTNIVAYLRTINNP
jgi:mono/diheme cytochrome c family protein